MIWLLTLPAALSAWIAVCWLDVRRNPEPNNPYDPRPGGDA